MDKKKYRNYDENIYLTISIKKGSKTYESLMADANAAGIKRQKLHDLIVTRLGDYYRMVPPVQADTEGEVHNDTEA